MQTALGVDSDLGDNILLGCSSVESLNELEPIMLEMEKHLSEPRVPLPSLKLDARIRMHHDARILSGHLYPTNMILR